MSPPRKTRRMELHPSVAERLARLAPDQRAAATAPPGPVLCIAPAGSGKTTTLVARVAWLVASGTSPGSITVITFSRRAAGELTRRLDEALAPLSGRLGSTPDPVRVRTFHALGLEILADAGVLPGPPADRSAVLRELVPDLTGAGLAALDTFISRLKVELGVGAAEVRTDPEAGPLARAFVAYEDTLAASDRLDFDDLVLRALRRLGRDAAKPGAVARPLQRAPRRRGPGRRSGAAGTGPAAGGPGQPDLPRRRRRPDRSTPGVSPTSAGCSTSMAACLGSGTSG